jgi:hypothetical protein
MCGEGLVCDLADGLDAREEAKDSEGPEAAQDADERDTACGGVHGQALRIKRASSKVGACLVGRSYCFPGKNKGRTALESWSDSGRTMALASQACSV